ncbi:MAG: hypothetical protein IIT41_00470 [Oscillospiraceae bacterium]|nr:hypothetical protein [Oscillospiraceae bacterium]
MSSATGNNNDKGRMAMYVLVMIVSGLLLLFLICSCKTTEYVEVPVVHTEYVYKESKDTAYVRDSVYIKEVQKGDTIRITEYRDRYRFRYITTTDTIVRVDSVAVPYPVEVVKVDHQQTWLQKTLMNIGLCFIFGFVLWLVLKRLKI